MTTRSARYAVAVLVTLAFAPSSHAASAAPGHAEIERTACPSVAAAQPIDFNDVFDDDAAASLRLRWNTAERAFVSHDNDGPRVRFYGAGGLVRGERAYALTEARFVRGADGVSIEARFLHISTRGDSVLVSAALVEGEANAALDPLIERAARGKGRVAFDVGSLAPRRNLRAAPEAGDCEPATRWTAFDRPIEASPAQIAALAALLPSG